MPFRRPRPTADQQRRAEESLAAIEAGGCRSPRPSASRDFREAGGRFFTSDLSVKS
jgi:hypothetical protein